MGLRFCLRSFRGTIGADNGVVVWKRVDLNLVGNLRRELQPGTSIKHSARIDRALNTVKKRAGIEQVTRWHVLVVKFRRRHQD